MNAYAERFARTIKEACLDRMILFGEASLRKSIQEFVAHERNHQELGNRLILPDSRTRETAAIRWSTWRGGLLNYCD